CAFEPADGTWIKGDPIVRLLDLYTLWALRHLYMKQYGRWPGRQSVRLAYERILELRSDEFCGCNQGDKLYGECCQDKDLNRERVADAVHFAINCHGGNRNPPKSVVDFVCNRKEPPEFRELLLF
ncbi:MAG TPA: hypothetical protein VIM41_01625, partial [Gammaproteobacteria bacterium]